MTHGFRCYQCAMPLASRAEEGAEAVVCSGCGTSNRPPKNAQSQSQEPLAARLSDRISRVAGVEKLEGFSLKEMFSEVFSKHSDDDVERYFTVGSSGTTPSLDEISTKWPKPWVFFRMFIIAALVYFAFVQAWNQYGNPNVIPGLIIVGSFAVPFSTVVFFFEMNVARNVSIYQLIKLIMIGGVLSLIFSLVLFQFTDSLGLSGLGASLAGLVEEPGKLLALAFMLNKKRYPYILNGLLFGAAVGAAFAAFESAGYALRYGFFSTQDMKDVIWVRGVLSPFGHIVWTAMSAAALWRVKGARPFEVDMLKDVRFKRVFFCGVALHMLWNSPLDLPFFVKYIALGAVAWVIVFSLIQEGLKQLRSAQRVQIESSNGAGITSESSTVND